MGSEPNMDIELQPIERNDNNNDGSAYSPNERVTPGNGAVQVFSSSKAEEGVSWVPKQFLGTNGETNSSGHAAEAQEPFLHSAKDNITHKQTSSVSRIKRELNEVVFWRVRLWMVLVFLFLFVLIFAVIGISIALCSVIHEDVDEKYDPSSFKIPLYFNGSFRLTNQIFTAELLTPSNQSQALSTELQEKLTDLYSSSPALGRYFSKAEIYAFRNGSVIAQYRLEFLLPREHVQLEQFTLSREVVYNVFRQFLYDQEPDDPGLWYIDLASLNMI